MRAFSWTSSEVRVVALVAVRDRSFSPDAETLHSHHVLPSDQANGYARISTAFALSHTTDPGPSWSSPRAPGVIVAIIEGSACT